MDVVGEAKAVDEASLSTFRSLLDRSGIDGSSFVEFGS